MSVPETIKNQFIEFIKLQAFDDQYISRQEEKRILEVGVKNGIGVEESLDLIRQVAADKGLVVERDAEEQAQAALKSAASNDGKVDKKEFENVVNSLKTATKGKLTDQEIKQRLKKMMEDNAWQAKEGGLFGSKWYSEI
jgi:2-hydroxychromene-2-carboxylate isomerase